LLGQVVGYRRQGKHCQGSYWTTIGSFKRNNIGQEEMAHAGGRKDSE